MALTCIDFRQLEYEYREADFSLLVRNIYGRFSKKKGTQLDLELTISNIQQLLGGCFFSCENSSFGLLVVG